MCACRWGNALARDATQWQGPHHACSRSQVLLLATVLQRRSENRVIWQKLQRALSGHLIPRIYQRNQPSEPHIVKLLQTPRRGLSAAQEPRIYIQSTPGVAKLVLRAPWSSFTFGLRKSCLWLANHTLAPLDYTAFYISGRMVRQWKTVLSVQMFRAIYCVVTSSFQYLGSPSFSQSSILHPLEIQYRKWHLSSMAGLAHSLRPHLLTHSHTHPKLWQQWKENSRNLQLCESGKCSLSPSCKGIQRKRVTVTWWLWSVFICHGISLRLPDSP